MTPPAKRKDEDRKAVRDLLAPHPDPRTEAFLARLLDEAPPLTGTDRDRIVRLLRRAEHDRTTPGETRPAA